MNEKHVIKIAEELKIRPEQVKATGALLEDGATMPFIARYRKEVTGSLDEVAIIAIRDRMARLEELDKRRESMLKSLKERDLLTDELKEKILTVETLATLEDIYLPFRPKRRTRATVAREKGLEPFAKLLFEQDGTTDPLEEATAFINEEKGVLSIEEALAGARDIIAEWVNEDQGAREKMRALFMGKGIFRSKVMAGKEETGSKYRDYFDREEPVATALSHRILAMRRGEKECVLDLRVSPPEDEVLTLLEGMFIKGEGPVSEEVKTAVRDSYKRMLSYSMETEVRLETRKRADAEAIKIFADNLRELLLAPPLGQRPVTAIDPGIRTGCKVACLDGQGKLLKTDTIYLVRSQKERLASAKKLKSLVQTCRSEAVAVGNGTAGRETEAFVKGLNLSEDIPVVMVNESGASVYSASQVARTEFPDLDVSVRGAVSIGRRLMDPLAELVKIDPKSIGVGQYQHDVNQHELKRCLDDVVSSCVNGVGVEVNTASEQLLAYVSGLGPRLAKNIVAYRNEHGPLLSRADLKKVPRLGPKAFEQAAGFLRVRNGKNSLDASAVHPESYAIVKSMAKDLDCRVKDLLEDETLRRKIDLSMYVTEKVGMPTLNDILCELAKPGRDPRKEFESFSFSEEVQTIKDLRPGMRLPGVVTNVTAFGAFVDIGVHQDGLVYVSQLADRFVKDPHQVVKVHQRVMVTVLEVDLERNRIALSMRENGERAKGSCKKGSRVSGKRDRPAKSKKRDPESFNNPFARAFRKKT